MTSRAETSTRARIVRAAVELLEQGGRSAVTTRAVCEAAGVQPPTIYRKFGDMEGVLAAAVSEAFAEYLASKRDRPRLADPVDDLRQGWNLHVEFGLTHPAVYALMYGNPVAEGLVAVEESATILRGLVQRIAEAGRLRVGVELAARAIHAAGRGVTLSLIETPPAERDPALSEVTREAVLAALTTDAEHALEPDGPQLPPRAVALKAVLDEAAGTLTPGETRLLSEWLDRLARPLASARTSGVGPSDP